jgi:hypothetical protein
VAPAEAKGTGKLPTNSAAIRHRATVNFLTLSPLSFSQFIKLAKTSEVQQTSEVFLA